MTMPRRFTFCRLHFLTWPVMGLSLWVLYEAQGAYDTRDHDDFVWRRGWPWGMVSAARIAPVSDSELPRLETAHGWLVTGAIKNLLFCSAMLFSVAFTAERWLRSNAWFRFRLSTILRVTTAVAITFALLSRPGVLVSLDLLGTIFQEPPGYHDDAHQFLVYLGFILPWHLQVPLVVGILCTVDVALSLTVQLATRMIARQRPEISQ